METGPIGGHAVPSTETVAFYATAVTLWLIGVVAVVYLKLRRAR